MFQRTTKVAERSAFYEGVNCLGKCWASSNWRAIRVIQVVNADGGINTRVINRDHFDFNPCKELWLLHPQVMEGPSHDRHREWLLRGTHHKAI